jgi:hypothetical protein
MSRLISLAACALVSIFFASSAYAHHGPMALGSVRISQTVMVGGTVLQPGTYQVRDTGEHAMPLPGQSEEAQTRIEIVKDGTVVARDIAEVMAPEAGRTVGTSGGAAARLKVETLKGGDFIRISTTRDGERLLIHLAVAK